jgi:hypothetical protein
MRASYDMSNALPGFYAWRFSPAMVRDLLQSVIERARFVPFEIHTRDDQKYLVHHREDIWMPQRGSKWALIVGTKGDIQQVYIPLITSIRPIRARRAMQSARTRRKAG